VEFLESKKDGQPTNNDANQFGSDIDPEIGF
jgi:hypothetical protein